MNELSKEIYINIIKSGLLWEATRTPVLPCLNVIEWITWKVDHENREILNFEDKSVASYKVSILIRYTTSRKHMSKLLRNG